MFSLFQKPISSVAPTSIHHSGILSNVYQTSSIKVQPVEPQTLTTTKNSAISYSSPSNVQSSQTSQLLMLSPPQSSSTPQNSNTPEVDKSPKPALPPKPAIKPPPRQTQIVNEENMPPPLPVTDPPDEKPSTTKTNSVTKPGMMILTLTVILLCQY